jgi:hypothetical protein
VEQLNRLRGDQTLNRLKPELRTITHIEPPEGGTPNADTRWGVTEEQGDNDQVLDICA